MKINLSVCNMGKCIDCKKNIIGSGINYEGVVCYADGRSAHISCHNKFILKNSRKKK